jgi:site-specific DNA recombinase
MLNRKSRLSAAGRSSLSRFSRDSYVHHALRAQLSRVGVTLRSVNEPIDESSMGKFMENIGAATAQFDNNLRADRSVQGMKARLERGGWTFPPPLGYIKSTDANGCKKIVPDPERGWLVTKAFEQYATGLYTRHQVLQDVSKRGLTSKGESGSPHRHFTSYFAGLSTLASLKFPRGTYLKSAARFLW